ncbi:MAG: hypothetical protein Q4G67_02960 [Actinomycetia bacterium]|nr:hypothetical protein [Actinomycetes bacterium]
MSTGLGRRWGRDAMSDGHTEPRCFGNLVAARRGCCPLLIDRIVAAGVASIHVVGAGGLVGR